MLNLKVNPPGLTSSTCFRGSRTPTKVYIFYLCNRIPKSKSRFSRMIDIIGFVASLISLLSFSRQIVNSLYAKRVVQKSDLVKYAVMSLDHQINLFLRVLQNLEQDLKDPYIRIAVSLWDPSGQEHQQYLRRSIIDCKTALDKFREGLMKSFKQSVFPLR